MARIRSIKPEFFRHESLQDLELQHPQLRPMLVFSALWGHCDKYGVFEWRPKQLSLDILPFVWRGSTGEALGKCLALLGEHHLIERAEIGGKVYGFIPTFEEHQRISGKEKCTPSKFPDPEDLQVGKHQGSTREAPVKHPESQEGKGKEVLLGREINLGREEIVSAKTADTDPDALRLSGKLADMVLANTPTHSRLTNGKRDSTVQAWAVDIGKLHRLDGYTWQQIEYLIVWAQKDTFWAANILSGKKLRQQADTLVAQIKREKTPKPPTGRLDKLAVELAAWIGEDDGQDASSADRVGVLRQVPQLPAGRGHGAGLE